MTSLRYEPFPLVEISGTPRMRGLAYGRQAKQRIFKSIAHYKAQAERLGLSQETLSAIIEKYIPIVSSAGTPAGIFAPYLEEIQGIAEGSGATFQDIFLLNARTEVMKLAVKPELRAQLLSNEATDGCTAVTVMPSATASGHLIHAQNWDWKEECAETGVVLRILCDDGPSILTCFSLASKANGLFAAPSKLHHAAFGQSTVGDASGHSGVHDGTSGWAQAHVFVQAAQLVQGLVQIKGFLILRGQAQLLCP